MQNRVLANELTTHRDVVLYFLIAMPMMTMVIDTMMYMDILNKSNVNISPIPVSPGI